MILVPGSKTGGRTGSSSSSSGSGGWLCSIIHPVEGRCVVCVITVVIMVVVGRRSLVGVC